MNALRLALCFIRVPKLFISLLLWPLLLGLFLALGQLLLSTSYLDKATETSTDFKARVDQRKDENEWLRGILFGTERLAAIKICRWEKGSEGEHLPDGCKAQDYDVALRVGSVAQFDTTPYANYFDGSTRHLHVCENCTSDITIEVRGDQNRTHIKGLIPYSVFLLSDSASKRDIQAHVVESKEKQEQLKDMRGKMYILPEGLRKPVNLTDSSKTMVLVTNVACMVVIVLWLALRAHRRVLDYFAQNDALLPLVAACGKSTFYNALWIITLMRVFCFVSASVPLTYLIYTKTMPDEAMKAFLGNPIHFVVWVAAIMSSLAAITLIASIAELKQRHSWVNVLYKYVPMALCLLGTLIWLVTIAVSGTVSHVIQSVVAATPILGLCPMILSPVLPLYSNVVVLHALLSSGLALAALSRNSKWFAAHLEEI